MKTPPRQRSPQWPTFSALIAVLGYGLAASCSVINPYEEKAGGNGGSSGSGAGGSSGEASGGSAGSSGSAGSGAGGEGAAGSGGESGSGATSGDGGSAGSAASGGSGGESGSGASGGSGGDAGSGAAGGSAGSAGSGAEERGLLVFGGKDSDDEHVLSVLAPESGEELLREQATYAAIAYDAERDIFFMFAAGDSPAPQNGFADLVARRFDRKSAQWEELGTAPSLPPPLKGSSVAVLNRRLVYLSWKSLSSSFEPTVTLLDTNDLENIQPVLFDMPALSGLPFAVVGQRGSVSSADTLGGSLSVATCDPIVGPLPAPGFFAAGNSGHVAPPVPCPNLNLYPFAVSGTVAPGTVRGFDAAASEPVLTDLKIARQTLLGAPQASNGRATVRLVEPISLDVSFSKETTSTADTLGAVVGAECEQAAVFSEAIGNTLHTTALFGVHVTTKADLGRLGEGLFYDPYNALLVAPSSSALTGGGSPVTAFRVQRGSASVMLEPLVDASEWNPPADLRVLVGAVRFPSSFECPSPRVERLSE